MSDAKDKQPAVGWVECARCLGTGEALPAEGIGYCQDCGGMGRLRSMKKTRATNAERVRSSAWFGDSCARNPTGEAASSMKRTHTPTLSMKCYFCGTETPAAANGPRVTQWADARGWDWFTGMLPATIHACPKCSRSKECAEKRKTAYAKAQDSPNAKLCDGAEKTP